MNELLSKPSVRRAAMLLASAMTIWYLAYRGLYTLNLSGPYAAAASVTLFLAELYGGFLMFLFYFQIWDVWNPEPVPVIPGRTVDVMIPTYNEDPTLLRGTISAALKIEYPHRTLVLDDGKRAEVKALCEELGAEYITRPTNLHAKAGNLNHALEMTSGEFVVIFDADHVAETHFISRLIGYFADERMGFVQTPHAFYNFDAYQGVLNYKKNVYWEEGMLFYNVTQPGKNRWNGVSFCGSAAMFRRQALEEVGLIATQSITEDMHTGLRMHAKGWKSLFVNERLIAAIAADDVTSFNTQRLRWGEGNLGIFAFDNPLTIKGLTFAQRLCYLGSMLSWTTGVQKLLIYATPIAMLATGVAPVERMTWQLFAITAVYLVTIWSGVKIASNGYGMLLAIELTQMACFWTQVRSTWRAIFKRKRATFVVTAKRGRQSNSILKHLAPQITLITASAFAMAWALARYCLGISNDLIGLIVGSGLAGVNCYLAWLVIKRALRTKDRRAAWRHPIALHVNYRGVDANGVAFSGQCVTRDINEGGVGLVAYDPLPKCDELDLTIVAAGRGVTCRGAIRHVREEVKLRAARGGNTQAYSYGVQFVDPTTEQLAMLWWLGAQFAVSFRYERFHGGQFGLGSAAARRLPEDESELPLEFPVKLQYGAKATVCTVTESVNSETLLLLLPEGLPATESVSLEMATPFGNVEATGAVVESKARTIAGYRVEETRLRLQRFKGESRSILHSVLGHHDSKALAGVIRSVPRRRLGKSHRPAAMVTVATGIAASIAITGVMFFNHEDAVLASAFAGRSMSENHVKLLSDIAHRLDLDSKPSELRLLQLRKVMVDLGRTEDIAQIDDYVARTKPTTGEGLALKAGSLQGLHRESEAETIFTRLLADLKQLPNDEMRRDVVLAAARNAAQLDLLPLAVERFKQLEQFGPYSPDVRAELAGVLYQMNKVDEAITLIKQGKRTSPELLLLASIYSSERQFAHAASIYRQVLEREPNDLRALRGVADNSYWGQELGAAAEAYRAVLERTPDDDKVTQLLAEVLLSQHEFAESLDLYAKLLDKHPQQVDLYNGFLLAAERSSRLSSASRARLLTIYQGYPKYKDDQLLVNLLNAVARHGLTQESLALMQHLVKLAPQNGDIRLRLADALHQAGQFELADVHYRWLMTHPAELQRSQAPPSEIKVPSIHSPPVATRVRFR